MVKDLDTKRQRAYTKEVKYCLICDKIIDKNVNLNDALFSRKKYCSSDCRMIASHLTSLSRLTSKIGNKLHYGKLRGIFTVMFEI